MASLGFRPPSELDFNSPNLSQTWKTWKQQFSFFLSAIEYDAKPGALKVSSLLNIMGPEGVEVYNNLTFRPAEGEGDNARPAESNTDYDLVIKKFDEYCQKRDPQMTLRGQFWTYERPEGQTFEQYLTVLRTKAKDCKFLEEDGMIRDKLFFDLKDNNVKLKVMGEFGNSDLQTVITKIRMLEGSKKDLEQMTPKSKTSTDLVHALNRTRDPVKFRQTGGRDKSQTYGHSSQSSQSSQSHSSSKSHGKRKKSGPCGRCGTIHGYRQCPAYGKTCHKCSGKNHFASMCKSKRQVHTVEEDEYFYIDTLYEQPMEIVENITGDFDPNVWMHTVKVEYKKKISRMQVKLDTGATTNVIPLKTYKKLREKPPIMKTNTRLTAYGGQSVAHLGKIKLECSVMIGENKKSGVYEFYVADVCSPPILGLRACNELGLVKKGDETLDHEINLVNKPLTKEKLLAEYPSVFQGRGKFSQPYHIELDPSVKPVIHAPRRVPHSLHDKLKDKLDSMEKAGVISKVDKPTDWVSSLVIVEKKDGTLRVCLDPKDLNKAIKREHFHIPTTEEVVSQLGGKSVFTILDQKEAYWQVQLDDESAELTTFNTPFGRYCFQVLPFGVCSASEILQKRNYQVFGDIPGVHMISDDMIVGGDNDEDHDQIIRKVMVRAKENNVGFNPVKLQFKVPEVGFMGGLVGATGLKPDPQKVRAIVNIPDPKCAEDLHRLLGMINYLSQFIPNKSALLAPLQELLKAELLKEKMSKVGVKSEPMQWKTEHAEALEKVKKALSSKPVLKLFEPAKELVIQCDASSQGLGATLLQEGQPLAYASRALTKAEKNYAQIEKELKAIVFATEKFNQYIYGRHVTVHSDHKPLEAITRKPLHKASPRLQLMLLQLLKYSLDVKWVPGKELYIADTLSRAYEPSENSTQETQQDKEMELRVHSLVANLPMSEARLAEIQQAVNNDESLQELKQILVAGWPSHIRNVQSALRAYWPIQDEIHEIDGLLFVGERLLIPQSMRSVMLQKVHESHQGMEKCKVRARSVMYWPGMGRDIEDIVSRCSTCNRYKPKNIKEPLMPHEIPELPWSKVGMDIMTFGGSDYLIIVDYRSKYPEVMKLKSKTAKGVVVCCKEVFARHGIPLTVVADNMPFASVEMHKFAKEWDFEIITSSPTYAQSNGQSEIFVKTVKQMMRKAEQEGKDMYLALMDYRNTPPVGMQYSPAQMLMSRRLRGNLPVHASLLEPQIASDVSENLKNRQETYKKHYDKGAKPLPKLKVGDSVRIQRGRAREPAIVSEKHDSPRSYIVTSQNGQMYRRNRRHLMKTVEPPPTIQPQYDDMYATHVPVPVPDVQSSTPVPAPPPAMPPAVPPATQPTDVAPTAQPTRTSGRVTRQPAYLSDYVPK